MGIQGFLKASLLALGVLSMATWIPYMYSCMRTLFMVSLPSVASAVVAPKCLFVFSNVIVAILVGESKFSRSEGEPTKAEESAAVAVAAAALEDDMLIREKQGDQEDVMAMEAALVTPVITDNDDDRSEQEREDGIVVIEEVNALLLVGEGVEISPEEEGGDVTVGEVIDMRAEVEEGVDDGLVLLHEEEDFAEEEEVCEEGEEASEERDFPPDDELNRRVEDFIARFNMERQLEVRMLVCCC